MNKEQDGLVACPRHKDRAEAIGFVQYEYLPGPQVYGLCDFCDEFYGKHLYGPPGPPAYPTDAPDPGTVRYYPFMDKRPHIKARIQRIAMLTQAREDGRRIKNKNHVRPVKRNRNPNQWASPEDLRV